MAVVRQQFKANMREVEDDKVRVAVALDVQRGTGAGRAAHLTAPTYAPPSLAPWPSPVLRRSGIRKRREWACFAWGEAPGNKPLGTNVLWLCIV